MKDLEKRLKSLRVEKELLMQEIENIDSLLRLIGFPRGIESIRKVARDVVEREDGRD